MAGRLRTTWPRVLAWRMRRQLLDPFGELDEVEVVRRLCGVQAQVPAAAALAVRVRQQSSSAGDLDRALDERRLMRTWAMRGTLHLLAPDEAGAYLSLVGAARSWEKGSWRKAFGVAPDEMVTLVEAWVGCSTVGYSAATSWWRRWGSFSVAPTWRPSCARAGAPC